MLHNIVIFSTVLMMAVKVQAQCSRPAFGANLIMIEGLAEESFPEHIIVKFMCSTGYVPVDTTASRSITCTGAQWSELKLQCIKKSCGNPGDIFNGQYQFQPTDAILFGAVITAVCNEGYQLVGKPDRNCREFGWDGRAPVCEVVKCLPPSSIKDGVFVPEADVYEYGDGVEYSCSRGLDLIGPSTLTCSSNGTFQPAPPRCLSVSCERPEILNAFRIEGKSPPYKFGDFVRYQCNKGYTMEGSDFVTCKEAGWNPPPPQCTAQCEKPAVGENQIMIDESDRPTFPEGFTINFRCSTGYVPFMATASKSITCIGTQWSELELQCKKKSCGNPGDIFNGQYQFQPTDATSFGAVITAVCNEGYQLVGKPDRNCREFGWDGRAPVCEVVKCLPPSSIKDGVFVPEADVYEYGDGVEYSCSRGLDLIGPSILTCSSNGTFQPAPPRCLSVSCERPEILNAFRIEGKSPPYKFGDFVRYQCNKGYTMEGSDFVTCKEAGWNPPPPQCTAQCEKPAVGENRIMIDESDRPTFPEGFTINFRCSTGYVPFTATASKSITCIGTQWSELELQCKKKSCGNPGDIFNGQYQFQPTDATSFGAVITAVCNEGYQLVGKPDRNCREFGWDGRAPVCEVVKCLPPSSIKDGVFVPEADVYEYGDGVEYSCSRGLDLIGPSTLTCSSNGTFQPAPPRCLSVSCERPEILNAFRIEGKSPPYKFGDFVRYQCNKGYTMEGSDFVTCKEAGWNPPPPQCTAQCEKPAVGENRIMIDESDRPTFPEGFTINFRCSTGYVPFTATASKSITCIGTQWSELELQCKITVLLEAQLELAGKMVGIGKLLYVKVQA